MKFATLLAVVAQVYRIPDYFLTFKILAVDYCSLCVLTG